MDRVSDVYASELGDPRRGLPGHADSGAHDTVFDDAASSDSASSDAAQLPAEISGRLKRDAQGLVAAIIQQHDSREVLMLGWMDDEALRRTLSTGRVTFFSRSRQEYWRKGDTSGNIQLVRAVSIDCDGDALLIAVDQHGPACHTGTRTCFDGRRLPAVVLPPVESSTTHSTEN